MSSKEEISTAVTTTAVASNTVAHSTAAIAGGSGSTTTSYANVLQNLDSKKGTQAPASLATATATAVETKITTAANAAKQETTESTKESQPSVKNMKSWSDEVAALAEDSSPLASIAGEKRAAANADTTAENSSELDDNGEFVPVVSHHRRDRKKARKDKPRDGKNGGGGGNVHANSNQATGNQKSGNNQRRGNGVNGNSGNGGTVAGASTDKEGERKFPPRQRQRGGSPRKSNGANKSQQKDRKEDSPSASAENTNSGNEAKTGDVETQAQASGAINSSGVIANSTQPKKFVAAPPPKVNAWKVSG